MSPITTSSTAWAVVVASGALEVVFSITMKLSEGYTKLWPTLLSVVSGVASVWLMSLTLKVLPIGTAYAVWAGIGAAGTAAAGMALFQEPTTVARLACISLVIAGIIGLQLQGIDTP